MPKAISQGARGPHFLLLLFSSPPSPSPSPASIEGREADRRATQPQRQPQPPSSAMESRRLALLALLLLALLGASQEKPISLTYRCPCRYVESSVAKSHIKHLKILTVPGCSLQIIARLKNSSKQICIDPKLKWIQEYLEKYLHKRLKM
ncbi:stromal cell-derived factor 1 isoform X1 [Anolis carolinensis]|uniref:stromal cell-derived factor 1 isoform X1 n=2 Tax=Anolis carolinensis TaxID=28377 RepID=UPI002F2B4CDE